MSPPRPARIPVATPLDALIHIVGVALAACLWAWSSESGYVFGQDNQLVHLVELRRALEPGFLANDWFLNAGGEGVRHAYLWLLAGLSRLVGTEWAVFLVWCAQIGLVAMGGYRLGRALHGDRAAAYLAAAFCIFAPGGTLGDSWLVRESLNPGPLAKALGLLGLALSLERSWWSLGALVAATLVHVQVGVEVTALVAFAWIVRVVRAWHRAEPVPSLRPALVAAGVYLAVALPAVLPLLGGGRGLPPDELRVLVAEFRFPWHYLVSCAYPPNFVPVVGLILAGLVAMRLGGFRRASAALGAALALVALAFAVLLVTGGLDPGWRPAWTAVIFLFGLAAATELAGVGEASGSPARDAGRRATGAELAAMGGALLGCVLTAWVFVEVWPLAVALDLRLLRTTVFLKAIALVLVAGPLARAFVSGRPVEALLAALAVLGLFTGRLVPVVGALTGLALLPRFGRGAGALAGLGIAAGIGFALVGAGALREPLALVAIGFLAIGLLARLGVFAGPARRRGAAGTLALLTVVGLLLPGPGRALSARLELARRGGGDLERLAQWTRAHTEPDAVFLVPPGAASWRLVAERAVVADLKAVPFRPAAIREWHERMAALAGRPRAAPSQLTRELRVPRCAWPLQALGRGYTSLDVAQLGALGGTYGARYVVRDDGAPLPLPLLHREGAAALYLLPPPSE